MGSFLSERVCIKEFSAEPFKFLRGVLEDNLLTDVVVVIFFHLGLASQSLTLFFLFFLIQFLP